MNSREHAQKLLCESFGYWGKLDFPYVSMGRIDSLHLFGEPELTILALYHHNRKRWTHALDIGANLGLHSIIMARCGFRVLAYEPDFEHYDRLLANLERNGVASLVTACMAAVHTQNGEAKFVRVHNNLTGNHLEGFKDSYGPRSTVIVPTVDASPLWSSCDIAKIDCEGNEAAVLATTMPRDWAHLSAIVEVRNEANALRIYKHCKECEVPMWAAKRDWKEVAIYGDMPKANREGPLFIGRRDPWS